VGAIQIEATFSLLDVAGDVAETFALEAARPDPRNPQIRITRADQASRPHRGTTLQRSGAPPVGRAPLERRTGSGGGDAPLRRPKRKP
jgi:hypothetical protein